MPRTDDDGETKGASSSTSPPVTEAKDDNDTALLLPRGSFIELHSLSREDMNGKTGEIGGVDSSTGRYIVILDDGGGKSIKVKPINCRRLPLQPESVRRRAMNKAQEAYKSSSSSLTKQSFQQALEVDRCCVLAHAGLSQIEHMRGNGKGALTHLHRAIAHLYAYEHLLSKRERLRLQMEYVTCLGDEGDMESEAKWLEKVLQQAPTYPHAIMGKASNMVSRGLKQQSLPVWFQVLDCPDEEPDGIMTAGEVSAVKAASRRTIVSILVEMTNRILPSDVSTRKASYETLLPLYTRILQAAPLLEPNDHVKCLTYKGYILAFNAVMFKHATSWDEGQACFQQARFVPNAAPLIQSMILFYQALALELRGDNGPPETRHADYKEAMGLLRESEQVHTDPSTRQCFLRLQAKTNKDLVSVAVDPVTGGVGVVAVRDTHLESLPQGPTHNLRDQA